MGINKFIPQNIRRWMSPEDLKTFGMLPDDEARDKWFSGKESEMHDQFSDWLWRNEIQYSHPRMDKKTTIQKGQFDFMVWRSGKICWVEFKTDKGRLSKEQLNFYLQQVKDGTPALVAHSYEAAVSFVEQTFALTA